MDWFVALLMLTGMEIVLGIDNIVFLSILVGSLPKERQKGHSSPEHLAESRAAGFDAHLAKPIDLRQLERTLRGASVAGATSASAQ